jgi:hypothetical protein
MADDRLAPAAGGGSAEPPARAPQGWSGGIAVQRRGRQRAAAWLALPVVIAAMVAIPVVWTSFGALALALVFALAQLTFGKPSSPGRTGMAPASVRVEDATLHADTGAAQLSWPLGRLRAGWTDSYAGLHTAVIDVAGGDRLWVGMPSAADAERLLGLVRLTADKQVFSAHLASPAENMSNGRKLLLGALVVGPALAFFGGAAQLAVRDAAAGNPTSIAPRVVGALLIMLTVAAVMQLAVPPRVVVGSDGVRIEGRLRRRFVPFVGVRGVDCAPDGVWLRRDEGDVLLRTEGVARVPTRPSANTIALYHRVREARALGLGGDVGQAKLALLERRGQSVGEWLQRLRALPAQSDYRSTGVAPDELVQVLLDPSGRAEARIGAAAALIERSEPGVRERVRIAAGATANEKLRIAIDAVADDRLAAELVDEAVAAESEASGGPGHGSLEQSVT